MNNNKTEQNKRHDFFKSIKADLERKGFNDELPKIRQLKKNVKLITGINDAG